MRVLISSDLHIHKHKKSEERLQHCLDVLQWIFQTALDRSVDAVIICGDLFHEKQKIDVQTYQLAFKLFQEYCGKGLKVFVLMGNHDMYHKSQWEVSSIIPLAAINGVHIISSACTLNIGGHDLSFLPYTENPIEDLRSNLKNKSDFKILFGHLAVNGAILNSVSHTISDVPVEHDGDMVAVTVDDFDKWDQVFLGHYHCEQRLNEHVEYIGSPLQLSFGEAFSKKHIIIYDLDTHEKEYVLNTFSPQHLIIKQKEIKKHKLAGNFVRLMVDDLSSTDIMDTRNELLTEEAVATIEILQLPEKANDKTQVEDARAILFKKEEMIEQYVFMAKQENKLNELDEDKLIKIGKELLEGKKVNE